MRRSAFLSILFLAVVACQMFGAEEFWPSADWTRATPAEVGLDAAKLEAARDYALTAGGSGYITRHGKLVLSWGDARQRYDLKSSTKSFGSIALGLAVKDGKVRLSDVAQKLHPALGTPPEENTTTGWLEEVTLLHLATQTAGFEKPGGFTRQLFRAGTMWDYSDSGPNWLAECLTLASRRDLDDLMFERIFTPLGIPVPISPGGKTPTVRRSLTASRVASSAPASAPMWMRWRVSDCSCCAADAGATRS